MEVTKLKTSREVPKFSYVCAPKTKPEERGKKKPGVGEVRAGTALVPLSFLVGPSQKREKGNVTIVQM